MQMNGVSAGMIMGRTGGLISLVGSWVEFVLCFPMGSWCLLC